MTLLDPSDLQEVRKALGKSQAELAELLGVSTRAVQSYEQGWRPVPAHVQRVASLLLFLDWRERGGRVKPCWDIRRCSDDVRSKCTVGQLAAGDLCWLLMGYRCRGRTQRSAEVQMARCRSCEVMRQWLKPRTPRRSTRRGKAPRSS